MHTLRQASGPWGKFFFFRDGSNRPPLSSSPKDGLLICLPIFGRAGYNRGRFAGAGITNMYAVDAPVCPDGRPHQPKYDHLTAMHGALAAVAPTLLGTDAQVHNATPLERWDAAVGAWVKASAKLLCAFVYVDAHEQSNGGGGVVQKDRRRRNRRRHIHPNRNGAHREQWG